MHREPYERGSQHVYPLSSPQDGLPFPLDEHGWLPKFLQGLWDSSGIIGGDNETQEVITGDPNLELDEVGVPKSIVMNLTYPERGRLFCFLQSQQSLIYC